MNKIYLLNEQNNHQWITVAEFEALKYISGRYYDKNDGFMFNVKKYLKLFLGLEGNEEQNERTN